MKELFEFSHKTKSLGYNLVFVSFTRHNIILDACEQTLLICHCEEPIHFTQDRLQRRGNLQPLRSWRRGITSQSFRFFLI